MPPVLRHLPPLNSLAAEIPRWKLQAQSVTKRVRLGLLMQRALSGSLEYFFSEKDLLSPDLSQNP